GRGGGWREVDEGGPGGPAGRHAPEEQQAGGDGKVDEQEKRGGHGELPEPQLRAPGGSPGPPRGRAQTLISRFQRAIQSARCVLIFGQSSVLRRSRSAGVAGTIPRNSGATSTPSMTGPIYEGAPAMSFWLSGSSPWFRYSIARSVLAPLVMASQAKPAMPPSLGSTASTPVPFIFTIVVSWCHMGAMSISPRSRSVRRLAGPAWIDETLGGGDFPASNPGSMLPSLAPLREGKVGKVTVPNVLRGVLGPEP